MASSRPAPTLVWLLPDDVALPPALQRVPILIAGFEIESSWRTRKHIKGDIVNLVQLGASVGIIVLLGEGPKVRALREFTDGAVERHPGLVLVWDETHIASLGQSDTRPEDRESLATPNGTASRTPVGRHTGKYLPLWRWLRNQPDRFEIGFAELEDACGIELPPSCRRHPPHWHSYEGSAVARAIQDVGFRVEGLRIDDQRLTFVRTHGAEPKS